MSKDRISRVQARAIPYAPTPRRALHVAEHNGRSVRHVNACHLDQHLPVGKSYEYCNESIRKETGATALRAFYVQSRDLADSSSRYITCAKVACDNDLPNIQKADPIRYVYNGGNYTRLNDTRCFIASPPYAFTRTDFTTGVDSYRNISGTRGYTMSQPFGYDGVVDDVDYVRCYEGRTNTTLARQIRNEVIKPTAVATTAGVLASVASAVLPTQTAIIAASSQTATVAGLATVIGLAGSAAIVGGTIYAGYKFVQHFKTDNQVGLVEIEMTEKANHA